MLDASYVEEIHNSQVICTINTRPYWREVLEILAEEDIWVDYILSGFSSSPGPDDEGVVKHTLVCYDAQGWEGHAVTSHVLDQEKIGSVFGPWHILDDLQVYEEQEYKQLMEKQITAMWERVEEYTRLKKAGAWVDPYGSEDMVV